MDEMLDELLDEKAERTQFRLYPHNKRKLAQIARHLSRQRGEPVSHSAALRTLIEQFFVPESSPERPASAPASDAA